MFGHKFARGLAGPRVEYVPRLVNPVANPKECSVEGCTKRGYVCFVCKFVICWWCLGWRAPSVVESFKCEKCLFKEMMRLLVPIPGKEAEHRSFCEMTAKAQESARDAQCRDNTNRQAYSIVAKVRRFAVNDMGVWAFPPALPGLYLAGYIYAKMNMVNFQSIDHDFWGIQRWVDMMSAVLGCASYDVRRLPEVNAALGLAAACCPKIYRYKSPMPLASYQAFLLRRFERAEGAWRVRAEYRNDQGLQDICATILLCPSFVRRRRVFEFWWNNPEELKPTEGVAWAADNVFRESDISFFTDSHGTFSARLNVATEKTQHIRETTSRVFGDDNVLGLPVASMLKAAIELLPSGPVFSRGPTDRHQADTWSDHQIGAFLDRFSDETGFARAKLGCQSFRKLYAETLQAAGLSPDDLRTLGYWAPGSNAIKRYSEAEEWILDQQRPATLRRFRQKFDYDPSAGASSGPRPVSRGQKTRGSSNPWFGRTSKF